jgi:hypothetical protein
MAKQIAQKFGLPARWLLSDMASDDQLLQVLSIV